MRKIITLSFLAVFILVSKNAYPGQIYENNQKLESAGYRAKTLDYTNNELAFILHQTDDPTVSRSMLGVRPATYTGPTFFITSLVGIPTGNVSNKSINYKSYGINIGAMAVSMLSTKIPEFKTKSPVERFNFPIEDKYSLSLYFLSKMKYIALSIDI